MSFWSWALASLSSASLARLGRSTSIATAAPIATRLAMPIISGRADSSGALARLFCRRAGSRLILIMSLVPRRAHRQPDADQCFGRVRAEIGPVERAVDLDLAPRVGDLERQPRAALDRAVQRSDLRAAACQHDPRDVGVRGGRQEEVERALELAGHD